MKCFIYIFLENNNDISHRIPLSHCIVTAMKPSKHPLRKEWKTKGSKAHRPLGGGHPKFPERPWEQVRMAAKRG